MRLPVSDDSAHHKYGAPCSGLVLGCLCDQSVQKYINGHHCAVSACAAGLCHRPPLTKKDTKSRLCGGELSVNSSFQGADPDSPLSPGANHLSIYI